MTKTSTDLTEATNALVRRALMSAGYRIDGFQVSTIDRLCAWTSVYCASPSVITGVYDMLAGRFDSASIERRSQTRIDIIW
jgi:hypothetical protein